MDKNSKKVLNELWKEGQDLQKQVLDNLIFDIPDFTSLKPGDTMDAKTFFSKQFNRKREIQNKIENFSVIIKIIIIVSSERH